MLKKIDQAISEISGFTTKPNCALACTLLHKSTLILAVCNALCIFVDKVTRKQANNTYLARFDIKKKSSLEYGTNHGVYFLRDCKFVSEVRVCSS